MSLFELGVFTTIKIEHAKALHLPEHLLRLSTHAREIGFTIDVAALQMAIQNSLYTAPLIARLRVMTWSENRYEIHLQPYTPPQHAYKLMISPVALLHPYSHLKTTAYQLYAHARKQGQSQGFDDVILTTAEGILLETTSANILWQHQGKWYTPARSLPYLKGIMLTHLLATEIDVIEGEFTLQDIPEEAICFICNSLIGLHPALISRFNSPI